MLTGTDKVIYHPPIIQFHPAKISRIAPPLPLGGGHPAMDASAAGDEGRDARLPEGTGNGFCDGRINGGGDIR